MFLFTNAIIILDVFVWIMYKLTTTEVLAIFGGSDGLRWIPNKTNL